MTVTLTANYHETLEVTTAEKIDELIEDNYELSDMLEFIDTHSEDDFVSYYEEYVRVGEAIGYDAVDALIEEMGCVSYIEDCDEKYRGQYASTAEFAEEFYSEMYNIPGELVVDWESTWDTSLRYDYTACEAGYRQVFVFSDY